MKILNLTLNNFKKFRNVSFEFNSGLNVILGLNEAGKSTLVHAILVALFENPSSRAKKLNESILSWGQSKGNKKAPIIELTFEHDGIEYKLIKNFEDRTVSLKSDDGQTNLTDPNNTAKFIANLTGINTQTIFESTGYITHYDISNIRTNSSDLISAIHNAASSSRHTGNVQQKLKIIAAEIADILRGTKSPAKNPGPIKTLNDQVDRLTKDIAEQQIKWEDIAEKRENKTKLERKLNELDEQIKKQQDSIHNYQEYRLIKEKVDALNRELDIVNKDLSEINKLQSRELQIKIELKKYQLLESADINELGRKVNELKTEIKVKTEIIEDLEKRTYKYTGVKNVNLKPLLPIAIISLVVVLIFVLVANISLIFATTIFAAVNLIAFFYLKFFNSQSRSNNELNNKIKEYKQLLIHDESKLEKLLSNYSLETPDELINAERTVNLLSNELEQIESQKRGLLRNKTIDELEELRNDLAMRRHVIENNEMTDSVKNAQYSESEARAIKDKLGKFVEEQGIIKTDISALNALINSTDVSLENINSKQAELESINRDLRYYENRVEVLTLTEEFINKALSNTAIMASKILKTDIDKYLAHITSDNYSDIAIDEDLNFRVKSNATSQHVKSLDHLSSGTIDQIHFLVRLAMFKLLTGGSKIMLMLDDPFVTFDKNRLNKTIEILNKEGENYQILLFSHNDYYSKFKEPIYLES